MHGGVDCVRRVSFIAISRSAEQRHFADNIEPTRCLIHPGEAVIALSTGL
jgi:hypothetical protein